MSALGQQGESVGETNAREVFGEALARLYVLAGDPPLKKVASTATALQRRRAPTEAAVSAQRISDWRRGRAVPAKFESVLPVLQVLVAEARKRTPEPPTDGLYDLSVWSRWWTQSQKSQTETAAPTYSGECPYPGLAAFTESQSALYFGRSRSTTTLLDRISEARSDRSVLVLVGMSGAGKSSLLRAGLVQAVRDGRIDGVSDVDVRTPRAGMVAADVDADAMLVVDQFEELFTDRTDVDARAAYVAELVALAEHVPVVVGLRADFYSRCLEFPKIGVALEHHSMVLGPMTDAELREAVVEPAKAEGLRVEPALLDTIIAEFGSRSAGSSASTDVLSSGDRRAGRLPLLSHALRATWSRRQNGKLTAAAYRAVGGAAGSVAEAGEAAWRRLTDAQQRASKTLCMRLVAFGTDTDDGCRRRTRAELLAGFENSAPIEDVLEVLAAARLVTIDAEYVSFAHDAVLRAWPRLARWIEQDRDNASLRQRVEGDAETWLQHERAHEFLYRGAQLVAAQGWARDAADVPPAAGEFVAAATHRATRARSWLRAGVAALTVLGILATVSTVAAFVERGSAVSQRDDAVFGEVLAKSDSLLESDPSLSAQLLLVAQRSRPDDPRLRSRMIGAELSPLAASMTGHVGSIYGVSYSPDAATLASAGADGTVRLWDVGDPSSPRALGVPLEEGSNFATSAVFSPDGSILAASTGDGTVGLWNVTDMAHPVRYSAVLDDDAGPAYQVAFAPDGRTLAVAKDDSTVRLWDVTRPDAPRPIGAPLLGHAGPVRTVEFSPDGRTLASGGDDNTVRLWNTTDVSRVVQRPVPLTGFASVTHSVAFAPPGALLAVASDDGTTRLWNVDNADAPVPLGPPLPAQSAASWSVDFGSDGNTMVTSGKDGSAQLWSLMDPARPVRLGAALTGNGGGVLSTALAPDGRSVVTAGDDGTVRIWQTPDAVQQVHRGRTTGPSFATDGSVFATGSYDGTFALWHRMTSGAVVQSSSVPVSVGRDGGVGVELAPKTNLLAAASTVGGPVQLWDTGDPAAPRARAQIATDARFTSELAFDPAGTVLLTPADDRSARLWDVRDPAMPRPIGLPLSGFGGFVTDAVFSSDGRTVWVASADDTVRGWAISADGSNATSLPITLHGHSGDASTIALGPDDRVLVSASNDVVRVWDVSDPTHPEALGEPFRAGGGAVQSLALGQDGSTLAVAGSDGSIELWDFTDPAHVQTIGPVSRVAQAAVTVAFDPAGTMLSAVGQDGVLQTWTMDDSDAAGRICRTTGKLLTEDMWARLLPNLEYRPPC
ncbi:hypothetical protein [Rhodococcus sp. MALMAid1271]|uniref:nSTAND1 domain-containing NTPase n=1 Tax=Rhodococcus sp. MALMAid1271 TaxID=3411744 RepID=UPI003BA20462